MGNTLCVTDKEENNLTKQKNKLKQKNEPNKKKKYNFNSQYEKPEFQSEVIDPNNLDLESNLIMENDFDVQNEKVSMKNFTFLKVIGRGGFGKVILVEHKQNKKKYAIKIIIKEKIKINQQKYIMQEKQILQNLNSKFSVKLHYSFQTPKKLYMVLDFCEGGELYQLMQREFKFDEEITKFITAELVLGIQDLHDAGIIYRDLKPENILIDQNGHLKLTDYGLSKNSLQGKSETNTMCGTPEYLAPEILCSESYGKSSDWYSLGCLFYEMLHGEVPFQSKNKHQMYQQRISKQIPLNQNLSFQAKELARGLLAVNPKKRLGFQSIDEIKNHAFFQGLNWQKLSKQKIESPLLTIFKTNKSKFKYFNQVHLRNEYKDTPCNDMHYFKGFSYDKDKDVQEKYIEQVNQIKVENNELKQQQQCQEC